MLPREEREARDHLGALRLEREQHLRAARTEYDGLAAQLKAADEERMRQQIDELERRAHELRDAQASLVRSERLASVGRLAAGLAHEIGNPIAALMGIEDLLLEGAIDEAEQKDFVRRMRAETERIHRILRDLLDFARPASGVEGAVVDRPDRKSVV